jgi:synaptojanin
MGKEAYLLLISRRRFEMAGTRFNARGLDEEGNCANCVETEMIVEYPSQGLVFSHVQIRGSIPIFWS